MIMLCICLTAVPDQSKTIVFAIVERLDETLDKVSGHRLSE